MKAKNKKEINKTFTRFYLFWIFTTSLIILGVISIFGVQISEIKRLNKKIKTYSSDNLQENRDLNKYSKTVRKTIENIGNFMQKKDGLSLDEIKKIETEDKEFQNLLLSIYRLAEDGQKDYKDSNELNDSKREMKTEISNLKSEIKGLEVDVKYYKNELETCCVRGQ